MTYSPRVLTRFLVMGTALLAGSLTCRTAFATKDVRCGAYCLYIALSGLDIELPEFEAFAKELGDPGDKGYSMSQLADTAARYKASTLGVITTPGNLRRRGERFACIALFKEGHFVLITGMDGKQAMLIDPPNEQFVPIDTLATVWPGTALLISKGPLAAEETLQHHRWTTYIGIGCAVAAAATSLFWWRRSGK